MKKKSFVFILGVVIGLLSLLLLQNYSQLLVISTNETVLDITVNVISSIVITILSAIVAFLVAYFQIKKEKEHINKENYISNLKYLNVLKYECEINLHNVNNALKSIKKINPKVFLANIDNIFSMNSWDVLYLKIDVSEGSYDEISKLYRMFRKIKGTSETEFEVTQLNNLVLPLTKTISLINSDISNLDKKIKDL